MRDEVSAVSAIAPIRKFEEATLKASRYGPLIVEALATARSVASTRASSLSAFTSTHCEWRGLSKAVLSGTEAVNTSSAPSRDWPASIGSTAMPSIFAHHVAVTRHGSCALVASWIEALGTASAVDTRTAGDGSRDTSRRPVRLPWGPGIGALT